jgi:hypothetical protein
MNGQNLAMHIERLAAFSTFDNDLGPVFVLAHF